MRLDVPTPCGTAWVDLDRPRSPVALLVLGHGAGGSVDTPDLLAIQNRAVAEHIAVARVTQPYRVAGRRTPAPAARLDEAWLAVVTAVRRRRGFAALALVVGGRSSGARVACRTAVDVSAAGVVALAFPVHPPGRPEKDRLAELGQPSVPVLVVQGDRDAFGMPPGAAGRKIVVVPGADHSLKQDPGTVAAEVVRFVTRIAARARFDR